MKTVRINTLTIGGNHPCVVVAELGAWYEDLAGMKALIQAAKRSGVDMVKVQTYQAETIALPGAEFEFEDGSRMSQFDFFKQYEISRDDHKLLFDYAQEIGVAIFSTPSYYDDVDFLDALGVPAFKVGSDDLTNYPFLEYIARKNKPMIVSTGMSTLYEINDAVRTIIDTGNDQIILLHCTSAYPPAPQSANLNIIKTLQKTFNIPIGYSDHVPGVFSSVLAVSMGACLIEKHITLDRSRKRPDYQISLEPAELKTMIDQIRMIPLLQGSSTKDVYPQEKKWRNNARKSLVAVRDIKKGEVFQKDDIKIMRPGTGIQPRDLNRVIGKAAKKDVVKNDVIPMEAVE